VTDAWSDLAASLASVEAELVAKAPDAATAAEVHPYLARLLTTALHDGFLTHEDTGHGLKRLWPRFGGPYHDYRMWQGPLVAGQSYRFTATLHDVERLGVGTYKRTPSGVTLLEDYVVFQSGQVDLTVGHGGQLRTSPETQHIMVRELLRPPGTRAADMRLTLADGTALPPPPAHCDLARTAGWVVAIARNFARWSELMAERPNELTLPPEELAAAYLGDAGTHYFPGYYDLAEDEVLVVERPALPCYTWSLSTYTHWLEPLPHPFTATALTDNLRLGLPADAAATFRLSPTAGNGATIITGRRRGAMLFRTIGAEEVVVPRARVELR
jgi:hypothetical protein